MFRHGGDDKSRPPGSQVYDKIHSVAGTRNQLRTICAEIYPTSFLNYSIKWRKLKSVP